MSKDPAFLFYPNDYLGGTMGMTFEEKGAYIELLMMQFNRGHMTSHMVGQLVGQIWDKVKHKFIQDSEGKWYNERLELEVNRRREYTESRKNNLSGINQYTKKKTNKEAHMDGHMTSHMENEDEDVNINDTKNIDYNFFVEQYHSFCPNMTQVKVMNKTRKGYINARVKEFGVGKIVEVLSKAGKSDFLNGNNSNRWKADFEWIIRPENFVKVLEGKYDNKKPQLAV